MSKRTLFFCCILVLFLFSFYSNSIANVSFEKYHQPDEVEAILKSWTSTHSSLTKLINIGQSTSNQNIFVLRIAAQSEKSLDPEKRPAVFVSGNIEGTHLVGTEASLMIIEQLLKNYQSDQKIKFLLQKRTVYVAPLLNPDVAQHFFDDVLWERWTNHHPIDDDLDSLIDEDCPDDLNNDGVITQMRVKDPEGTMIPDPKEPRLMRKANSTKGEKGIYTLYPEGLDNDGDDHYNEDPPGGVEINRNFMHDFEYHVKEAGCWPASQKETIVLLDFLFSHQNIAMVLNFSTENTFLNLQQTGQAKAASDKVKVPERFAGFLGLDPDKEYTLTEIVEVLKGMNIGGGMEIDESMVAMFLGLGPAVKIHDQDRPLFEEISQDYKDALKEAKLDYPEKRAQGVGKGSFVPFCYFQYGVPVFSSDLWRIPEMNKEEKKEDSLTVDQLKTMSSEDFLALGEEKIDAFMKEMGAPSNFKASMVIQMVESGRVTPKKMAEMIEKMPSKPANDGEEHPQSYILKWSDEALDGKGFINWKPFNHPTLGNVEIGGFVPYLEINPPVKDIKKTASFHADFYIDLMDKLAFLNIEKVEVKNLGEDYYKLTVFFTNPGYFPTSTAQGRRARTVWPITVKLETEKDQIIFSGHKKESIPFIDGKKTRKVEWTIKGKEGSKITLTAGAPKIGSVSKTIVLKEQGG
ncbi:MAG: M14 family metallopeptidase [Candidatus Aminicenantaceae bacterium]